MAETIIRVTKEPKPEKMAPQGEVIYDMVKATGAKGITRTEGIKKLQDLINAEKFKTVQKAGVVWAYYQQLYKNKGLFDVEKVAPPKPDAKAEGKQTAAA